MAKKSIVLGTSGNVSVNDLIVALQSCKDSDRFTLKLCTDQKLSKSETESANLRKMLYAMYELLIDAKKCVSICAGHEAKTGEKTIYYDKHSDSGATGLLKDIDAKLNSYCSDLVQIDLKA